MNRRQPKKEIEIVLLFCGQCKTRLTHTLLTFGFCKNCWKKWTIETNAEGTLKETFRELLRGKCCDHPEPAVTDSRITP
jgi:hypothetical protein